MIRSSRSLRGVALASCIVASWLVGTSSDVVAAPVFAAPIVAAPAYVANYAPAGNYAAVTAFSPPVYAPTSEIAVTSYYAPASVYSPVVSPVMAAPVTAYYAPAAVAMPLYRRGPFGGLRPVRSAYYIGY
jgi:hypothetical protein